MFVSKKDFEDLKREVEEQRGIIFQLIQEIEELKKPKEPAYFG